MRKVTEYVGTAFCNGHNAAMGNTASTGDELLLYGNVIARRVNGVVIYTLAGWNTATTRARLNGVLPGGFRIANRGGKPYIFRSDGKSRALTVAEWFKAE